MGRLRTALCGVMLACFVASLVAAQETYYVKGLKAYQAAQKLARAKKPAEAQAAYLDVAKSFPKHELADDSLYNAAQQAQRRRKYKEAADLYDRIVKEYPQSTVACNALYSAGYLYYGSLRDRKKGGALFERAASYRPGYTGAEMALYMAAICHNVGKDYEGVVRVANTFAATRPKTGSRFLIVLAYKASAQLRLGKPEEALATVGQIKKLAPGAGQIGSAYYQIAAYYNSKRQYKGAAENYQRAAAVTAYESASMALIYAAQCHERMKPKDGEGALRIYQQYLDKFPKGDKAHDAVYRMAAVCRNILKDRAREIQVCDAFLKKHPKSLYADRMLWSMAQAYRQTKQVDKALAVCRRIMADHSASDLADDATLYLVDMLAAKGDKAEARKVCEKLVNDRPGSSSAARAVARLKNLSK